MDPHHLLKTLQLHDSFFPTGAFSFSDGLESAVAQNKVQDGFALKRWLDHYLYANFRSCDGLAFHKTWKACLVQNWEQIQKIDQELTALKPSASVRMSSQTVGQRFLKTCLPLYPHPDLEKTLEAIQQQNMPGNAAVVHALVLTTLNIPEKEALLSYGYSSLAAMVSAALRLMSIGQQEGQEVLAHALATLPFRVEELLKTDPQTPLSVFNPLLDIQQMQHRHLYTRLFRS